MRQQNDRILRFCPKSLNYRKLHDIENHIGVSVVWVVVVVWLKGSKSEWGKWENREKRKIQQIEIEREDNGRKRTRVDRKSQRLEKKKYYWNEEK